MHRKGCLSLEMLYHIWNFEMTHTCAIVYIDKATTHNANTNFHSFFIFFYFFMEDLFKHNMMKTHISTIRFP